MSVFDRPADGDNHAPAGAVGEIEKEPLFRREPPAFGLDLNVTGHAVRVEQLKVRPAAPLAGSLGLHGLELARPDTGRRCREDHFGGERPVKIADDLDLNGVLRIKAFSLFRGSCATHHPKCFRIMAMKTAHDFWPVNRAKSDSARPSRLTPMSALPDLSTSNRRASCSRWREIQRKLRPEAAAYCSQSVMNEVICSMTDKIEDISSLRQEDTSFVLFQAGEDKHAHGKH